MVSTAQFREEIKVADPSIGKNGYRSIGKDGYKMDGEGPRGMRREAGLKGCHCCDYFIANKNSVVLIEETRLSETVSKYKQEYRYLRPGHLDKLTNDRIREENTLKAYGALLVLCRLAARYDEFQKIIRADKYHFWLVASDAQPANMISFEELENRLFEALRSAFGKQRFCEITIVPGDMLENKISAYAPTY